MRYRLICKDNTSGKDGCPALYDTDDPEIVGVVGYSVEQQADLAAGLGEGEVLIHLPRNVLDQFLDR